MAYVGLSVSIPVAQQGFTGSKNPTQMGPGHLTYADGVDLNGGLIQKEGGAAKLNESALGAPSIIRAGFSYAPAAGTYHTIVFCANGSVYLDTDGSGAFSTTVASGLNDATQPPPMFVVGGGESVGASRHLFMFSGTNQVQELTGSSDTTMVAIDTPAADWASAFPTFGCVHIGRLWGGGNSSDPHRLYYSESGDHEDFVNGDSGSLAIFPGEGEKLVGAISYRGVLIAFKYPTGIYVVDTRDPVPANWLVQKLSDSIGGVNGSTIVQIDKDVLFLDASGHVNAITAVNIIGDMHSSDIGRVNEIGPFIREQVNLSRLQRAVGIFYPIRHQAWFMLPRVTEDDCNLRMIIDMSRPDIGPRFLWSRRDTAPAMWLRRDSDTILRPAQGDTDGFVWLLDRDARNKDGVGYPMRLETSSTDLSFADPSLQTKSKSGQFLEIVTEPTGDWFLTVEIYWDDTLTQVVQYDAGFGGSVIGIGELDSIVLAASSVRSQRERITGSGRRIKLVAYNNNVDEDIRISDFILSFVTMDERDSSGGTT